MSMIAVSGPHSTTPLPPWGDLWMKCGPRGLSRHSESAEQGSGQVPIRRKGPQIGIPRLLAAGTDPSAQGLAEEELGCLAGQLEGADIAVAEVPVEVLG